LRLEEIKNSTGKPEIYWHGIKSIILTFAYICYIYEEEKEEQAC
jgi:hypothetical protein